MTAAVLQLSDNLKQQPLEFYLLNRSLFGSMSSAKFVLQPELCFEETYVLDRTCGDHMCGDFNRSYVW